MKLREVSVGYTFDQPWVARSLGMSSVELRVAGRNLKTWTKYTGLDPETTVGGAIVARRWNGLLQPAAHPIVRGDRQSQPLTTRGYPK